MQGHSFDQGAVRMTFNRTQMKTGPGQFKLDPYLIKTGSLDSVIKQTIYEANLFNTERQDLVKIYEDRNALFSYTSIDPWIRSLLELEISIIIENSICASVAVICQASCNL